MFFRTTLRPCPSLETVVLIDITNKRCEDNESYVDDCTGLVKIGSDILSVSPNLLVRKNLFFFISKNGIL